MESYKQEICPFFQDGRCKFGKQCKKLHQLDYKKEEFEIKICYQFQKGFCKFGNKCKFSHQKIQKVKKKFNREKKEDEKLNCNEDEITQNQNISIKQKNDKNIVQGKKNLKQQEKNEIKQVLQLQQDLDKLAIQSKFVDISKTSVGKQTYKINKTKVFEDKELFDYINDNKLEKQEIDYYQVIRKYMSSYEQIDLNIFKISYSPSFFKESLQIKEKEIEIVDYFDIFINRNDNYSCKFKAIKIQNEVIDKKTDTVNMSEIFLSKLAIKLQNMMIKLGMYQGIKHFDSYLDQIINKINEEIKHHSNWQQEEQQLLECILKENKQLQGDDKLQYVATQMLLRNMEGQKYRTEWEIQKRVEHCKALIIQKQQQEDEEESSSSEEDSNSNDRESEQNEEQEDECQVIMKEHSNKHIDIDKEVYLKYNVDLNQEIYLDNLDLKNIATGTIDYMLLLVICKTCKTEYKLALAKQKEYPNYLFNQLPCNKCNPNGTNQSIIFKNSIFHEYSSQLGIIGSYSWIIKDILKYRLVLQCGWDSCDQTTTLKEQLAQAGVPLWLKCGACYKQMQFSIQTNLIKPLNTLSKISKDNRNHQQVTKNKKIQQFKVGTSLPEDGKCKHYKYSFRYFRFSCCAKAYACDICHNMNEKDHAMEMAKTIICGFCSLEQRASGDPVCTKCKGNMTKPKGSTNWEGGKGCRNKNTMSKNDSKKYEGTCKTVSKKAYMKKQ